MHTRDMISAFTKTVPLMYAVLHPMTAEADEADLVGADNFDFSPALS